MYVQGLKINIVCSPARCLCAHGVSVLCAWYVCQVTGPGPFNLSIVHHDQYSAYLVQCNPEASFSGDVTTTFLNLAPEGGLTQHLEIQQAMLPALFTVSLVLWWSCVCSRLRVLICLRVVPESFHRGAVPRRQSRFLFPPYIQRIPIIVGMVLCAQFAAANTFHFGRRLVN